MSTRGVLASVHGVGKIDAGFSDYYMVDEVQGTYRGMMIAIAPEHWSVFDDFELEQFEVFSPRFGSTGSFEVFSQTHPRSKEKERPSSI